MFVMVRKMVVSEGHGDKVVQRFSQKGIIEEQEGFVDLTVLRQKARRGEEQVLVIIRWESEDHWKQWEKSDAHKAAHRAQRKQPKPDYLLRTEVDLYEVATVKKASLPDDSHA